MRTRVVRAVAVGVSLVGLGAATPAAAGETSVQSFYGYTRSSPYITFRKGTTTNSTLTAFASYGNERYRLVMRAGSGTGTNDCERDVGWLPNGWYYPQYNDNKDYGSDVVRGSVWFLGSKRCSAGTVTRSELFIHSRGANADPWNGNYATQGCIKVASIDRLDLRGFLRAAHNRDSESVYVY